MATLINISQNQLLTLIVRIISLSAVALLLATSPAYAQDQCAADTDVSLIGQGEANEGVNVIKLEPTMARVVQIVQTGNEGPWWSIGELKVYKAGGTSALALNDYQTYEGFPDNNPAIRALDGKNWTLWQTGLKQAPGQSFTVTLKDATQIDCIVMHLPKSKANDYPRAYEVKVWETLDSYHQELGTPNISEEVFSFPKQSAQHIRLVQTGTTESRWWGISELDVYAADGRTKIAPSDAWVPLASSSSERRGEVPAKAIDGLRGSRWSTDKAQESGQFFTLDLGESAEISRVRAVSINKDFKDESLNGYPEGLTLELSDDGVNWHDPANPDGTDSSSPITATAYKLSTEYPLAMEHRLSLRLLSRSGYTPLHSQSMAFSACNTDTDTPTFFTSASLRGKDSEGVERDNQGGVLIKSVFDRISATYKQFEEVEYPECKELIGVTTSSDCSVVAALCRTEAGRNDATDDLVENYKQNHNSSKLIVEGKEEMWLYEWLNGDIHTTAAKYPVSKSISKPADGSEIGQFSMVFGESDNSYGISLKVAQPGGHQSDSLVIVSRDKDSAPSGQRRYYIKLVDEDGANGGGWANSCGPGHTYHNRLSYNPVTREYAVLCSSDSSWVEELAETRPLLPNGKKDGNMYAANSITGKKGVLGSVNLALDSRTAKLRDGEKEAVLFLQKHGFNQQKGGAGPLIPYGEGWIGLVIGAQGDPLAGGLDYTQDGEYVEPKMDLGVVVFDKNGETSGVTWLSSAPTGYISHPQLVTLGNGNLLLGYGVMHADINDGKSYGELHHDLVYPKDFYLIEFNPYTGETFDLMKLPLGAGWGEMDEFKSLGQNIDGRSQAGWSSYAFQANTRQLNLWAYTSPNQIVEDELPNTPDEELLCPFPNQFVVALEPDVSRDKKGIRIVCQNGTDEFLSHYDYGEKNRGGGYTSGRDTCREERRAAYENSGNDAGHGIFCHVKDKYSVPDPSVGKLCPSTQAVIGVEAYFDETSQRYTGFDSICSGAPEDTNSDDHPEEGSSTIPNPRDGTTPVYEHETYSEKMCQNGFSVAQIVTNDFSNDGDIDNIELLCQNVEADWDWNQLGKRTFPPLDYDEYEPVCQTDSHPIGIRQYIAGLAGGGFDGLLRVDLICPNTDLPSDTEGFARCAGDQVVIGLGTYTNDLILEHQKVPTLARVKPICGDAPYKKVPAEELISDDTDSKAGEYLALLCPSGIEECSEGNASVQFVNFDNLGVDIDSGKYFWNRINSSSKIEPREAMCLDNTDSMATTDCYSLGEPNPDTIFKSPEGVYDKHVVHDAYTFATWKFGVTGKWDVIRYTMPVLLPPQSYSPGQNEYLAIDMSRQECWSFAEEVANPWADNLGKGCRFKLFTTELDDAGKPNGYSKPILTIDSRIVYVDGQLYDVNLCHGSIDEEGWSTYYRTGKDNGKRGPLSCHLSEKGFVALELFLDKEEIENEHTKEAFLQAGLAAFGPLAEGLEALGNIEKLGFLKNLASVVKGIDTAVNDTIIIGSLISSGIEFHNCKELSSKNEKLECRSVAVGDILLNSAFLTLSALEKQKIISALLKPESGESFTPSQVDELVKNMNSKYEELTGKKVPTQPSEKENIRVFEHDTATEAGQTVDGNPAQEYLDKTKLIDDLKKTVPPEVLANEDFLILVAEILDDESLTRDEKLKLVEEINNHIQERLDRAKEISENINGADGNDLKNPSICPTK